MTGLSEDEVEAIAKHEHVPALIALELGNRLRRGLPASSRGPGRLTAAARRLRDFPLSETTIGATAPGFGAVDRGRGRP